MTELRRTIRVLFDRMRGDPYLQNRWLTAQFLVSILNRIDQNDSITVRTFNQTMNNAKYGFPCDDFGGTNLTGVYRKKYCNSYFYYITDPGRDVQQPILSIQWAREIEEQCSVLLSSFNAVRPPSNSMRSPSAHTLNSNSSPPPKKKCKRRSRYLPSPLSPPSKKRIVRMLDPYSPPIPKKIPARVRAGNKAIGTMYEKAVQRLRRHNEQLEKDRDELNTSITTLMEAIENQRSAESDPTILIKKLGNVIGTHLSKEGKLKAIITTTMKEFDLDQVPADLFISVGQSIFQPWKIGLFVFELFLIHGHILILPMPLLAKAMDLRYTGLNLQGLETIRKVQCGSRYQRGMIPSSTAVKKICSRLEDVMKTSFGIKPISSYDESIKAETISFDAESLLRFLLVKFGLEEVAKESSIEIAITADGAQFTNHVGHVTIGYKIIDSRARCPLTNSPLFVEGGYQSVDNCFPIRTIMASENRSLFLNQFGDVYGFVKRLGTDGLPHNEKGPALRPFTVLAPHDGKAVIEIIGRGGGAKMTEFFCPYCSITDH
jgi:hypothetical protein